jgi:hypothetical protein
MLSVGGFDLMTRSRKKSKAIIKVKTASVRGLDAVFFSKILFSPANR